MPTRQNIWLKKKFNELRDIIFQGRCYNPYCKGTSKELQFAHIKRTKLTGVRGRGMAARYYDIKKNIFCYTLLCKHCHEGYDGEWLDIDPELSRDLATFAPATLEDIYLANREWKPDEETRKD